MTLLGKQRRPLPSLSLLAFLRPVVQHLQHGCSLQHELVLKGDVTLQGIDIGASSFLSFSDTLGPHPKVNEER